MILVGSNAFWQQAAADISSARSRVLVQAMTFEGDAAGQAVAAAIQQSAAANRQILVDDYSLHFVSDRYVHSPFASKAVRTEAMATLAMFDRLVADGVGVHLTNPIGQNPARYATRNHKKLIVADNISYIGGINFSDHNFAWHDMMLRIDNEDCANFLAADFLSTWHGMPMYSKASFDGVTLYALDGIHNKAGFVDLFAMIAAAKVSIDVVSAYPTFPFMDALGSAVARGVSVQLYTPLPNNKPLVRDYLLDAARRSGITVGLLPEMTHLKAMLIDGHTLIAGSSNFDFVSYHVQEELLALVTIPELIEEFKQQVLTVAAGASLPGAAHRQHPFASLRARAALWATDAVVRRLQHNRRGAVDWSAAPIRSLRRPPIETVASGS